MNSVQPLRISKNNTPASSPQKMVTNMPLAEIGSNEKRRNSPSYNQATRKMIVSQETSPYTENSSPPSFSKSSTRDFWNGREMMSPSRFDTENTPERSPSPVPSSPRRRPSVERLAQASRVRNSNIFALESKDAYDPASLPIVERPSANRPANQQVANSPFTRYDSLRKENNPYRSSQKFSHNRTNSETNIPLLTPAKSAANVPLPASPEKRESPAPSPTKSSLARNSMFGISPQPGFDPENGTWSDGEERAATPRTLNRHAKNVTFHDDPPEVNEYEEQTPEPSVSFASDREASWESDDFEDQEFSFDRGSSADMEREDSFDDDLENTDKTPVVLPEDWSRMSPDEARTDLVDDDDDVFEAEDTQRPILGRSESVASDAESRPLPPIPGFAQRGRSDSDSLAHTAERAASAHRGLPSPPKRASCSKDEILNMAQKSSLTLEDRLKLMSARDGKSERLPSKSTEAATQVNEDEVVITNLDTGEKLEINVTEKEVEDDSFAADLSEFSQAPPRISRESILRKVRNSKFEFEDESDDEGSEITRDSPERPSVAELAKMHPDQAVPSRENSRETSNGYGAGVAAYLAHEEVIVKDEPTDDDGFDMNSIPAALPEPSRSPSRRDDYARESSVLHHPVAYNGESEDDDASRYSSLGPDAESTMLHMEQPAEESYDDGKETLQDAMRLLTVKDYSEPSTLHDPTKQEGRGNFAGLPAYLSSGDYDFGMKPYITPSPPPSSEGLSQQRFGEVTMPELPPPTASIEDLEPPRMSYVEREVSPPDTPQSVIHYSEEQVDISPLEEHDNVPQEPVPRDSPSIPERQATIRTGGKLKTRKSGTQADLEMMAEQRRTVSGDYPVPGIPTKYQTHDEIATADTEGGSSFSSEENGLPTDSLAEEGVEQEKAKARRKSRKSGGRMYLGLDTSAFSIGDQDGLGLDQEFEKVIETQKKGYYMRENTKVVIASNRNFSGESNDSSGSGKSKDTALPTSSAENARPASRGTKSANSSPRKPSTEQFLKTEPWNGKTRRKSVRNASGHKTAYKSEPAPPLPGKESALARVNEDYSAGNLEDDVPEGVERGRLFVKVVGVKNLDLPMPKNDRVSFQLTLDNGLHCVTTSSLELGRSASIGQEFELIVLNDLEFQLTLTANLPPPPAAQNTRTSPVKSARGQKQSGISRLLLSPKKRAEKERLEREAHEAEEKRLQEEARKKRASVHPTAWDLLHDLVNPQDGSFARAYINLKAHEKSCFGRQLRVDVPCYNEWALEKDDRVLNSVRSKRGTNSGPIRRPPYVVGQLELQLLYVPKPINAANADLPKSMSGAIREMAKASEVKEVIFEGHLSQQGGDCIHWRRRFFRLDGPKLTAYHEHTHQKRAVINLSKASRLVDDRSTLIADPTTASSSSSPSKSRRRKSAFAEEDEGYQYVEEGFRLRFANGETIDFYADSRPEKDAWMQALSQVLGTPDPGARAQRWTDLVLARERGLAAPTATKPAPGVEVKDFVPSSQPPQQAPPPPPSSSSPSKTAGQRKPVPPSKSVPSSPVKNTAPSPAKGGTRSSTPPLMPRQGHRARNAVKSMIF